MYKKCGGNPCTWFLNGEGTCQLNGSLCANPFSEDGCKIQDAEIFHKLTEPRFKEGKNPLPILTQKDVFKKLDVKGRLVADYFVSYSDIDAMTVTPSMIIKNAIAVVRDKYNKGDFCDQSYDAALYIFQNVELLDGVTGIYVIMV